jgi:arsenate reductase-like glutaredoxin family protein
VDARKVRYEAGDLGKLFKDADSLVVGKGSKSQAYDLRKQTMSARELADAVLGPSGNLRAPAARVGKRWLVGFETNAWESTFKG